MTIETRGGIPRVVRVTVGTSGDVRRPPARTKHVQVSNAGANALRLYFTLADYTADASLSGTDGFISLSGSTGFYEGPAEFGVGNADYNSLWMRSESGSTTAVIVWYLGKG